MSQISATEEVSSLTEPFDRPIDSVRVSLPYRLGLLMVALAMVLLPLLYVGLIVVVCWGLYWHVTTNVALFNAIDSTKVAAFLYVTPIVVGSILVLFMIKPIFARKAKAASPVSLDPTSEPKLFAFVEKLCDAVGAPRPRRIDVDHQVNASASFRSGMWSLFRQDLVLTIGLPLVGGLTLRQLAGVLAHEFGHFAQGTGMRVTFVIRSINYWFARVVYERDIWDVQLQEWSKGTGWQLAIILYIARFFVWLTRRVLWALMMAGHAISCFMLRNMEFDADRYEARVAGSEAFEETVYRLQELNVASQHSFGALERTWRSGQLADDLPALIRADVDRLPEEVRVAIREHVRTSRTGALDTHPADLDRIESARREEAAGIFRLQGAAPTLFRDYESLCKRVTAAFYRQQLGDDLPGSRLVPTSMLVQGQQDLDASMELLQRYFQGVLPLPPGPTLPALEELSFPEDPRAAYRELREARRVIQEKAASRRQAIEHWHSCDQRAMQAAQALRLIKAGYGIEPEQFGLQVASVDEARIALERASDEGRSARSGDAEFESAARRRLELALRLIHHPQATTRLDSPDDAQAKAASAIAVLSCLRPSLEELDGARRTLASLSVLIQVVDNHEATHKVGEEMRSLAVNLVGWLEKLHREGSARHPFADDGRIETVGAHLVEKLPAAAEVEEVQRCADATMERLHALYHEALAALVSVAVLVEGALGMPPFGDPE